MHRSGRHHKFLGLSLECSQDMHFKAGEPHLLASVISNVLFPLEKSSPIGSDLLANRYWETVDEEMRAVGVLSNS